MTPSAADLDAGPSTVDPAEVEKFSRIAEEWWDPFGKFRPLHKFNPVRLGWLRDRLCERFGRDRRDRRPLHGLRIVDVGCGGGLVAEPMARLGATVVGIDASARNIGVARAHAAESRLDIDYRETTVEALRRSEAGGFDAVLNLEAVEHVADPALFVAASADLVRPGGLIAVASINRTLKAFALAKVGAEYVLGWLPRGTHDPRKFVRPEALTQWLEEAGMETTHVAGFGYDLLTDAWRVSDDPSVNYCLAAVRRA